MTSTLRKTRLPAATLAFVLAALAAGQAPEPVKLSLETAVNRAVASNPMVLEAAARWQASRGFVQEAKSSLGVKASAGASAALYDKDHEVDFGKLMGGPSLPIRVMEQWNPSVFGQVMLPIDLTGSIKAAASQAEFNELAAKLQVERARNIAALQAKMAYYGVIKARSARHIAEDSLEMSLQRVKDVQSHFEAGTLAKFDVVSAERDAAGARMAQTSALAEESRAIAALKRVTAIEQSAAIEVEQLELKAADQAAKSFGSSKEGAITDEFPYDQEFENLKQEAAKNRPEILAAEAMIAAAQKGIKVAGLSRAPQASISLNGSYQPNTGPFQPESSAWLGVSLSIPLLDSGLASARKAQAAATLDQAKAARQDALDQTLQEVHSSWVGMEAARSRMLESEAALKEAEEAYRLAKARFAVGVTKSSVVSPQVELQAAQTSLTEARSNVSNSRIDFAIAQAQLEHALGRSPAVTR